jgi:hypothetical protein
VKHCEHTRKKTKTLTMSALTDNAVPSEDVWKEEMRKCAEINAAAAAVTKSEPRPLIFDLTGFSGGDTAALYRFLDKELAANRQPMFRCKGFEEMRSLELRYRFHFYHERIGVTILTVTAPRKTILKK